MFKTTVCLQKGFQLMLQAKKCCHFYEKQGFQPAYG